MIKRQYNNDLQTITTSRSTYFITVQFNGYTASGKSRYRVGIIDANNKHYPHEIVYTTTSDESERGEAARVLEYYESRIAGREAEQ